jgi:hypothetical protein
MNEQTDFPAAYMRIRTLLDALTVNTLRYCLDGETSDEVVSRMKSVEAEMMHMIEVVGGEAPCAPGYFNCGGVCLPYACFERYAKSAD